MKVAILLNVIGEEAVELYNTFKLPEDERNKLDKVLQEFENYCSPKKNIVYERYKFFNRLQGDGEKFEEFLTDIKKLAQTCEFEGLHDQMIRDRIVVGVNDPSLKERLLRMGSEGLTLQKAVNHCRTTEISKEQLSTLNTTNLGCEVNKVVIKKKEFSCSRCGKTHGKNSVQHMVNNVTIARN